MIIVDTNVISEITRPHPEMRVVRWFERQDRRELHLASPVLGELLFGLFLMPMGGRRGRLEAATSAVLDEYFETRTLDFDHDAALYYGSITAAARQAGRTCTPIDAQIAAIALAWGASVASRDTSPFLATGVTTINPWTA